jgi:hypothetical protein
MQNFSLTINVPITAVGNIPLSAGVICNIQIAGIDGTDDTNDVVGYICEIYLSQTDFDNNENPIMVKGIHDKPELSGRPGGQLITWTGSKSGADFSVDVESVSNRFQLTSASIDSLKIKLKEDLATDLGINTTDIS